MSRTLKKENFHRKKFYILKLFCQLDHLYNPEIKVVLVPIPVEFQK